MSNWFPRADNKHGVNKILLVGCVGALLVVGIDVYGIAMRALRYQQYNANGFRELNSALLIVAIGWALVALISAWRFAIGKGLVWGSVLFVYIMLPLLGYFFLGRTSANIGWVIVRFPLGAALVVGIRGAWLTRSIEPETDYGEVFE